MANPFIATALAEIRNFPSKEVIYKAEVSDAEQAKWSICRDKKSGSIVTNDRLRVMLNAEGSHGGSIKAAFLQDVFAIGDCAVMDGTTYPATAQVANQKGEWLAKRLNRGDEAARFQYKNLGVMAYLGNCMYCDQASQLVAARADIARFRYRPRLRRWFREHLRENSLVDLERR